MEKRQKVSRRALEALVRERQAEIYRYLRYLGASRSVAEDLVQDTFLVVCGEGLPPEVADSGKQGPWLRGVARNLFLRFCRSSKHQAVSADPLFLERAEAIWTEQFLRGGDGFDYVEALRRCMEELAERQRYALKLRYVGERSRTEMAELLQMTENGVKSLLRRIRSALGQCVEQRLAAEET